ncbi:MAG: hypothetical protein AAFV53_05385 [Myxococcota bacterium]
MDQQEVADRLADILAARAARADQIRERLNAWRGLHEALITLQVSLEDYAQHPDSPNSLSDLVETVRAQRITERIGAEVVPRLQRVESRSRRGSLNIGVAGKARMGKSTLLQSISGLGDGQIPTGDELPVTAVRSRIFHTVERARALISFHTWDSFQREVLAPYFSRLGGATPQTVDDFRNWNPAPIQENTDETVFLTSLRDRLERMQRSLPSYRGYLNGEQIELSLDAIRDFVAYPDSNEERTGAPPRKYLAVREARIECAFPGVSVRRLGLIDLPGTGEIVAEERHVADLDDEVDVVLLITNPERLAYWDKESAQTLDLVLQARAGVKSSDFALIVVNTGGASSGKRSALLGDIQRRLRQRPQGGVFSILECDAIDPEDVRGRLLRPVLNHLAERLSVMDAAALAYAEAELAALRRDIGEAVGSAQELLENLAPTATPIEVLLVSETENLRKELARRFSQIVERRLRAARGPEAEDAAFEDAVSQCYQRARAWLADGLGLGEAQWLQQAERTLQGNKGSGELAETELNRVRVHISSEFNSLDAHLSALVHGLWGELWQTLAELLGFEAEGRPPAANGLQILHGELKAVGSNAMADAIAELMQLRLDYRTHFHPRMRRELDVLSPQLTQRDTGRQAARIVVAPTLEGAHEMLALLREYGEQAAYEAQKALLFDVTLPALVLHAASEQFDDAFLRAGASREGFLRYALKHRDRIWPGTFSRIEQANALLAASRQALEATQRAYARVDSAGETR